MNRIKGLNPELLIGLGFIYLKQGLIDAAEEVFSEIPNDHPQSPLALMGLIDVHQQRGDFDKVICLAKEILDKGGEVDSLSIHLGKAYYLQGDLPMAKKYGKKYFETIPENEKVLFELGKQKPGDRRPDVKTLIREGFLMGLSPHVVLDCLVPVLWEGRPASCCFLDQLNIYHEAYSQSLRPKRRLLNLASSLYQQFGIYTAFLPYIELSGKAFVPLVKVYFSLCSSLFEKVNEIQSLTWASFDNGDMGSDIRWDHMEHEGELLGYPRCCALWALNRRRAYQDLEDDALKALIEDEFISSFEATKPLSPKFAYYAYEFYPCDSRCRNAEEIGKDIWMRYGKRDATLSEIFCDHILPLNTLRILDYRPTHRYQDFIRPFDAKIYLNTRTFGERLYGPLVHLLKAIPLKKKWGVTG